MAKTDCLATADNDSTKKEELQCEEVILDIPRELEPPLWPECCIYRVPKRLREVQPRAYTPRLVSIGPFHYSLRKELKEMERQKRIYFWDFCDRTRKSNIEGLKSFIKDNEVRIRHCYSETFLLISSEEYIKMILLDAIFIFELFWRKYEKVSENSKAHEKNSENPKARYQTDYILRRPCMEFSIRHDLLLLENQFPFFVLKELYEYAEPNDKKETLLELSYCFFGDLSPRPRSEPCEEVKHFTDLVRYCFVPLDPKRKESSFNNLAGCFRPPQNPGPISEPRNEVNHFTDWLRSCLRRHDHGNGVKYTATKLDEAGLKFTTPDPDTYYNLLDIKLRPNECLKSFPCFNLSWLLSCLPFLKSDCLVRRVQRCLEVPRLCVDDNTEDLFRNLMALEQCHYPDKTYICDYIVLLDDLITTEADVMLLVENEIIENNLGSSVAVTKLFNKLGLEIALSQHSHYEELRGELNDYSHNIWNGLVGTLTKVYFTDFFKGTATVAGIIVLIVTLWNFISNRLGNDC